MSKHLNIIIKLLKKFKNIANNILGQTNKEQYIADKQHLFKKAAKLKAKLNDPIGARDLIEYAKLSEQNDYFAVMFLNKPDNELSDKMKLAKDANDNITRCF